MAYRINNTESNMTIMRMRAMYPSAFYKQDWYKSEEFVHSPLPVGAYDKNVYRDPTAVELVWLMLHVSTGDDVDNYDNKYIWTIDYDYNGDQIYIGNGSNGIEIHRHLTITDKWIHLNG